MDGGRGGGAAASGGDGGVLRQRQKRQRPPEEDVQDVMDLDQGADEATTTTNADDHEIKRPRLSSDEQASTAELEGMQPNGLGPQGEAGAAINHNDERVTTSPSSSSAAVVTTSGGGGGGGACQSVMTPRTRPPPPFESSSSGAFHRYDRRNSDDDDVPPPVSSSAPARPNQVLAEAAAARQARAQVQVATAPMISSVTGGGGGRRGGSSRRVAAAGGGGGGEAGANTARTNNSNNHEQQQQERTVMIQTSRSSNNQALVQPQPQQRQDNQDEGGLLSKEMEQFMCPICYDLLVRPVVIECGFTVCESCLAKTLQHADTTRSTSALAIFQPSDACPLLGRHCRFGPVNRLPEIQSVLHNHLRDTFPQDYTRRLKEVEKDAEMIEQVKSRRRRRGGARGGGGGGGGLLGAAVAGHGGVGGGNRGGGPGGAGIIGFAQRIYQRVREELDELERRPPPAHRRYPEAPEILRRSQGMITKILPWILMSLAYNAVSSSSSSSSAAAAASPSLSMYAGGLASSIFAHGYVIAPIGWWELGLLTTCSTASRIHKYKMTKEAITTLLRPRSYVVSRILWPNDRLLLAVASNDTYHQFVMLYYIIAWSLTTLYVTAYCMINRIKRRKNAGMSIMEIVLREIALLGFIAAMTELWSLMVWAVCMTAFYVSPCIFYHSWAPLDSIMASGIRLFLETVFLSTLFLGPAICPQELGLLEPANPEDRVDDNNNWENDLQALVFTRFSFVYMPKKVLRWF